MGGVRWDGEALQSPTQARASILGRAPPYMVNSTELSSSDWRAQQSQASDFSHYHLGAAASEMRGAPKPRGRPTASPVDNRLRRLSARTLRVSRSTYRQSSSAIVSERETGNEANNQNGNDLEAKGAFPAWIRGGVWLHAIGSAGAVRGRSTDRSTGRARRRARRRRTRSGNRDARDATAVGATHHSPSATAHAPYRSTCARRGASTAVAVRLLLNG